MTASKGFYCAQCSKGHDSFVSPCPGCGAFNSMIAGSPRDGGWVRATGDAQLLKDIQRKDVDKLETGTRELDRVLAGGFAFEGAYSLSGSPGAGKSTLCRQILIDVCNMEMLKKDDGKTDDPYVVLYDSAEETKGQVAQSSDRLGRTAPNFWVVNQPSVLDLEKIIVQKDPDIVVVDSIQTMTMQDLVAGSPLAVKECAQYLVGLCKARGVILIMICHVTKDGSLAGPKVFEHLVDGVLYFEDEPPFRVLRASKHRFGPTTEVGLFRMTEKGLSSVENPSELLLESHIDGVSGSVIGAMSEGNVGDSARAMLVELQALHVQKESGSISARGLIRGRCQQLCAVLEKRLDVKLTGDLYVSVAGGIESSDPGLDLPLALAILSSRFDVCPPEAFCAFGEVGLGGELRPPRSIAARLKVAEALGMEEIVGPPLPDDIKAPEGYAACETLAEVLEVLEWDCKPVVSKKSRKRKSHAA